MPVPMESVAQQRRPQLNSRACSYQDTSRYRASGAAPQLARTNSSQYTPYGEEDVNKPKVVGELAAVSDNAPEQVVERPALTRTFTREAWVKQMTSGVSATPKQSPSVYGPRQSPFIPGGHYNPSGSGLSTPAGDSGLTTSSAWGPASPSLTGTFNVSSDLHSSENNDADGKQTFAFTVHAERNLSAHSRPGTPVNDAGDRVPESVAETVERHREGQEVVDATPLTGRKVMVAVDAADQDGLNTLAYACDKVVHPGDVLYVVRVVREQRGFKGMRHVRKCGHCSSRV
ncbi:uncharacterized protein EV422DRAFT_315434 [Fimicolochytrium jonesii]|uniref:uncharacterized protein n=1 Tax=Fimicolochytrium jonesii TaxID=1396493 RepID=UPI0022FE6BE8|nr:uncharacterized protein EV422DRAFT_315434 [Fimicolochytrium jonesii]KAI8824292.1 hypothetical protein EV422DRAFT_315434 [Fimicolochytrium jonesii]